MNGKHTNDPISDIESPRVYFEKVFEEYIIKLSECVISYLFKELEDLFYRTVLDIVIPVELNNFV